MLEEVGRLTSLIESLLTISRADAGQIPLQLTTFRLMDLAREAASLLSILSEDKNQEVIISGDPDVEVSADRLLVRQALVNVLHNAVRHTPAGGGIVFTRAPRRPRVRLVERHRHGSWKSRPPIVRKSSNGSTAPITQRTMASGGTGLGLPIARWVLEAHGGTLTLQSAEAVGCTFQLQLPLATAS